jgi:hypothetical protein
MATRLQRLAALLVLVCGGCITGGYYRQQLLSPLTQAQIGALEPGKTTLAEALALLGAPLYVWEWKGEGAALAWGWSSSARWGFAVSVPMGDTSATAFSYDDLSADLPGAVLFFGEDDVLLEAREGRLAAIRAETIQRRPAPPLEEAP